MGLNGSFDRVGGHTLESQGLVPPPQPPTNTRPSHPALPPHPMEHWDPFHGARLEHIERQSSLLPGFTASAPFPRKPGQPRPVKQAPEGWPEPMQEHAFQGLPGDFVRLVLPQTEADPAALLVAFLAGVGCMMGRQPHFRVGASRHATNLFTVLVGETAKARKGTATDQVTRLLARVDPLFMRRRSVSGLSSGEGLIESVRDPREEDVPIRNPGSPVSFERQLVDAGEADKRLLVLESEFSTVLQQSGREGNILSAVLRDCWDGRPLGILARSNKDRCQEPHIALIGNITAEELKRLLTTNDRANGFGNRILWCGTRRSKLLSCGGEELDESALDALVNRIRLALASAATLGVMRFEPATLVAWDELYAELAEAESGLVGSMTARGDAQILRLATLYALLDTSPLIRLEHLKAANEVWSYCEESVRYLFGNTLGDETADAILKVLKGAPQGLTQTELNRGLSGHKAAAEIARALSVLEGKAMVVSRREASGGAPVTRWCLR